MKTKTKLYARKLPPGKQEGLPDAFPQSFKPFVLDVPGTWLILCDPHWPYHERPVIEQAVKEGKRRGLAGWLINGDGLDCHHLSRHDKDFGAPRYPEEIRVGNLCLDYLRKEFPRAEAVYKAGNHEERFERYLMANAPELTGLEGFDIPSLLRLKDRGIAWVGEQRTIELGKLPVVHGHEFGKGGGAHPAKWLIDKAKTSALCGHFHKTDGFGGRDVKGRPLYAWSVGCACFLHPRWLRNNQWCNGCAFVEVAKDGTFGVSNLRLFNGRLI